MPGDGTCAKHRADGDRAARLLAAGVRLICPLLLLGPDVGQPRDARGHHTREPRDGERHAGLGVLVGANARDGVDDVVAVKLKRGVERAVAPGAHVVTGHDALAGRDGQMDAARHVVGGHVPTVGDELPVQLTVSDQAFTTFAMV